MSESVRVTVNAQPREFEPGPDETAVEVLRDRLGLTGTKLVCGAGVCGACTVLLDDEPVVSCLLPATSLDGRAVRTVEGWSEGCGPGLHPVQRAFMDFDALQCGMCTPGFVTEGIAFYQRWSRERGQQEPTRGEVVEALAGHLCRCGAYPNIIAAIQAACAGRIAATPARVDAEAKVSGRAVYTVDVRREGQLEGRVLRSPHAHARVVRLDLRAAKQVAGVHAAVELVGVDRRVRYVGQEVAAIAAEDRVTAERALEAVEVEYDVLPAVIGAVSARTPGAVEVWSGRRRQPPSSAEGPLFPTPWHGNARGPTASFSARPRKARRLIAAARSAGDPLLVEGVWRTAAQVHTALEPHACVAHWAAGSLTVWVSTQACERIAEKLTKRFGLPRERVTVVAEHVGGAFGAKLELTPETVAAVELSRQAAAPVRVVLDRLEEMTVGGHRPAAEIQLTLLPARSGELSALSVTAYGDAGVAVGSAIAGLCRLIYPTKAKELVDFDVVNHMPPGLPFRGPGGAVACWALEQAVDEAAARLGEDPIVLRRRWDPDPLRGKLYRWAEGLEAWRGRPTGGQSGRFRRGVGVAAGNWFYWYQSKCRVAVGVRDGRLTVATATQDMGTGSRTVLARAVAGAFDLDPMSVRVRVGDSSLERGPMSGGSRTTATVVPAALAAAHKLRERLVREAVTRFGVRAPVAEPAGLRHAGGLLSWAEVITAVPDCQVVASRPDDTDTRRHAPRPYAGAGPAGAGLDWALRLLAGLRTGRGYTGAVHVSEVEVDTLLGRVRVLRVFGGLAVGRLAAPELARSQAAGSIVQGVGYALYEQRRNDPHTGVVLSAGLEDYRIPGIGDTPEIELHFLEEGFEHVPGGGVGLGEISTLPVAASIGNAVFNATGWRPYELPIRPDRLLEGLQS
ncbi:molybdopterin-dependent oxidoreductase [Actinophytocola sp.]|uniref:molybdopterin-dependent oxidoreductase n=1 Tax=Actinophytocola sp. TaxID=1872138 RepID=UPI003D6C6B69